MPASSLRVDETTGLPAGHAPTAPSACPICRSSHVAPHCVKDGAGYFVCRACNVIFQFPQPDRAAMVGYADTEYDGGLYQEYVEAREMKLAHFRARMTFLRPYVKTGRLLDLGSACGYFMEVANEEGFDVHGLEFSRNAIAAAHPAVRPRIRHGSIEALDDEPDGAYDVISAFDIIEHLDKPLELLSRARRLLRPGGHLVISTPDADHWLCPVMGSRWPMLQPMQHLTLFSWKALTLALEGAGFRDVKLVTAYKVISYEYLVNQLRTLNPWVYSILGAGMRLVPQGTMSRYRQVNIGEVLAIARSGH